MHFYDFAGVNGRNFFPPFSQKQQKKKFILFFLLYLENGGKKYIHVHVHVHILPYTLRGYVVTSLLYALVETTVNPGGKPLTYGIRPCAVGERGGGGVPRWLSIV